jgi:hypothetical protein
VLFTATVVGGLDVPNDFDVAFAIFAGTVNVDCVGVVV